MALEFEVGFGPGDFAPVRVPKGTNLAEALTARNSPILFGCRTGLCGTCLIEVVAGAEKLGPPTGDEREYLEAFAPPGRACRLACQVSLDADVVIRRLRE